jgi:hypothetical protein
MSRNLVVGAALALAPLLDLAGIACAEPAPGEHTAAPARLERNDLTGTWDRYRARAVAIDPRISSPLARESDPPLKPKYLADWQARQKASHEALQTPGQITIIEEAYRQVRYIYLDQTQVPIADAEPGFWGHSVGHWQGDTLVVNTVGIKEEVRFHDVPHSDQMQINERIRLLTPDRFEDQITIVDAAYLTKPWTFTWEYQRRPGYKMLEYVCEDNREYRDPKTGGQRLQLLDQSAKP